METAGMMRPVTRFGAVGDGAHDDTAAIQRAIDDCGRAGGGTVLVPAGTFLTGTLDLRDRVTLHLDAGAVLLASDDRARYAFRGTPPGCAQKATRCGLVHALGCADVAVTGRGRIAGRARRFWTPMRPDEIGEGWNTIPPRYHATTWRPMMVLFEDCRNVLVEGVTFDDAPAYAGWLIDCDHVAIRGVNVLNDFFGPNTDGFHLSSCRDVRVSDCHFLTGDDALAVDGNGSRPADGTCITHCTFDTSVNALRVYTGLDPGMAPEDSARAVVRNLVMADCTVANAAGVVNVTAENGLVENLSVCNIAASMEQEGTVFYLMNMNGRIRDVRFAAVTARCNGAATILGTEGTPLEGIVLDDVRFRVRPKRKWHGLGMPDPVPSYGHHHFAPFSLFVRHVRGLRLRDVSFAWEESDAATADTPLKLRGVEDVVVDGFDGSALGADPGVPVMDFVDVRRAVVRDCRLGPCAGPALRVSGALSADITLDGAAVAAGEDGPPCAAT